MWNFRHVVSSGTTNPMVTAAKNSREKLLGAVVVVIVAGLLTFTLVVNPQLKERALRLERMNQLELKLTKMKGDLLAKERIDDIYSQIEPLIAANGTEQQEISLFTRELSNLYSRLNVKILSVKILPISNEEFYRRLAVKVEMSGHIRSILDFILSVETYRNPIRIERLDLRAQEIVDNIRASFLITKVVAKTETQAD